MASINCPKCGYPLSDTTLVCVKCGQILNYSQPDSKQLCDMILDRINEGNNATFAAGALRNYGVPNAQSRSLFATPGAVVLKGIYKGNTGYFYDEFLRFGYKMHFVPSQDEYVNPANSVIDDKLREKSSRIIYNNSNRRCPRCTSSRLKIDRISGLFSGGYRWKHSCRDCGYTWKVM